MNIPIELSSQIIHYLTFNELTEFRTADRESREVVKEYEGHPDEYLVIGSFELWSRCFPKVKYLDLGNSGTTSEDFSHFEGVEELTTSVCPIKNDIFQSFANLKTLSIYSVFHRDSEYLYDIDKAFLYLSGLTSLEIFYCGYITDEAFVPLINLKHLKLEDCCQVTSNAIRGLKMLKTLHIKEQNIRDEAFEGSPIEELSVIDNPYLTMKGVTHLTNLKYLYCMDVPHVVETGLPACVRKLIF
jgi:hypothetical protein